MEHEVVAPTGHGKWVELDRAQSAEDLEDRIRASCTERAGASSWRATRKRRAASAETFTTV
jgi:hypothetical protein